MLYPAFARLGLFVMVVIFSVTARAADPRGDAPNAPLRSPEEERALFHLPPGFEIQLVAAEPELQKPMNLAFDSAGRVWVTGSTLYPWPARRDAVGDPIASFQKNWDDNNLAFRASSTPPEPAERGLDTVRVLSDFDPVTGRARKSTVFADGLNIPIGVVPLPRAPGAKGDTVLVFSIPAIWRLTDTDGDGRADVREKLYDGFGFKDTHGMSSNYWLWFDGWIYGTHGFANHSEIRSVATGQTVILDSGNTYRFRPDGSRFEIVTHGQTNPFGLAFDARGDLYTADSHSKPVYLVIPGGYYEGISKEHDGLGFAPAITTDDHGSSAIAGIVHYSATQFPPEFRGNLFNGNPVTRRINRDRLDWIGSTPVAARQADFLTSDDPAFRPVQVKLGPDGALWVADFYNPIIGHYEVPLTHPARDHGHGRLWRIVWRGLDQSVPLPVNPNLAALATADLVPHLSHPNLVVRSLAQAELLARPDAASTVPSLTAALSRLISGSDSAADETAALPLMLALERLGRLDAAVLRRALTRPDSDVALAALRTSLLRPALDSRDGSAIAQQISQTGNFSLWRQYAALFAADPQPWKAEILLNMLLGAPSSDTELLYALKLALKAHIAVATTEELSALVASAGKKSVKEANRLVAEICLAVPSPISARFLLGHLGRTQFAGLRAAEFARHAVQHLPVAELPSIVPLLNSLTNAPLAQRLTLAEGLALVAVKPDHRLPTEVDTWLRRELVAAVEDRDAPLALRAANALKPLPFVEKSGPLERVALDAKVRENVRVAALRALDPGARETAETAVTVLATAAPAAVSLRRAAAELLGTPTTSAAARSALAAALAGAPADLALTLVTSLAKSDEGTADLLELAAAGRVRPALLRHRYVALALEKRPAALRDRVAALTQSLPPEDARLDALVAYRLSAMGNFKPDRAHGAAVFAANCAVCHRFRDAGGNLGPSLDGIGSRSTARLVEDILDPNRNVDPEFRLTTVTLKSGGEKSGLNFREEGGSVHLRDAGTGAEVVVPKDDVAVTTRSAMSPMPAAFETLLSEQDFFDLLDYLRAPAK